MNGAHAVARSYTIAVDFDGVLHSYLTPWVSADVIQDPPVPGAIEWLREIEKKFTVVIFTTRGKTPEGQRAVRHWLHEQGWESGMNATVTAEKVPALIYLDDRAVRFSGAFPTADEIHRARPWKADALRDPSAPGPTGGFSRGKLTPDDEGDIRVRIGVQGATVYFDFGKPVAWTAFPAAQARSFAAALLEAADKAEVQ